MQGYPTIKLFGASAKGDKDAKPYQGERKARAMEDFVLAQLGQSRVVLDVKQLVKFKDFGTYCKEFDGICFIAFLPHIYDTTAKERNAQIESLAAIQKSFKTSPISFLWTQGG